MSESVLTAQRAELERVLSDARFRKAPALVRLLRFIVEETLNGRGDSLKEYQLGVEVFDRGAAFDPRVDPIVRVQARVLRQKLASYYATAGQHHALVIELPKGSYVPCFVPREKVEVEDPRSPAVATSTRRRRALIAAAVMTVATIATVLFYGDPLRLRTRNVAGVSDKPAAVQTVVVLPFANDGVAAGDEYLTQGLSEEIARALRKLPGVRVVPIKNDGGSPPIETKDLHARLGASSVVEGNIRLDANRLRIVVNLVRLTDGRMLWTETFAGHRSSLFEFQVRIAAAIATALAVEGEPAARLRAAASEPIDREAHRRYLQARHFAAKRTKDGMVKAIELYQSAIERDPQYALGYAGLAEAYALGIWYVPLPPDSARAAAKRAALTAVQLDPTLAEAHAALGEAYAADWQWIESVRAFERAIQLDPSYARAYHAHAYVLAIIGRRDEAVDAIRQALRLDPLSVSINSDVAEILYHAGREREAIEQVRSTLTLDAGFAPAYWVLGHALRRLGDDRAAVQALIKEKALKGESDEARRALERAFARDGWRGYWRCELGMVQQQRGAQAVYEIGRLYGWLGERNEAFQWLERAYQQRDTMLMNIGLDLRSTLGSDPRYERLARRVGIAAAPGSAQQEQSGSQ